MSSSIVLAHGNIEFILKTREERPTEHTPNTGIDDHMYLGGVND